ncbi:MAG TPA: endolytic transglycosylase MltG [bacterium]|nr:endolytic transglycosylase MltG [bacterium]
MKNTILCLVLIVFLFILFYLKGINSSGKGKNEQSFIIKTGQSVDTIASNLKDNDLIKSKFIFKLYVKLSKSQSAFQAGSYQLNSTMNIKEIVYEMTQKVFLKPEEKLTFIEGWNLTDYTKLIKEHSLNNASDFSKLVGEPMIDYRGMEEDYYPYDYSSDYLFLQDKPKYYGLEGYLFPDTYRFFTDASADKIIRKMLDNFDNKLSSKMRDDIEAQGKTIYEIITMASIIEKEVQSENDMKIVSGIFWDRIKNGQALESCATLAYILGIDKAQYSYEDTRINSPYNTYINRGLPPGPIANPGLKAIEASIYPEYTDYNYFLSDPATGKTIFSITYQEHLSNKNKYIK